MTLWRRGEPGAVEPGSAARAGGAAVAVAADLDASAGGYALDQELGERERELPAGADVRVESRVERVAALAVLVDAVAGDIAGAGMDGGVGVVAVLGGEEAVVVGIGSDLPRARGGRWIDVPGPGERPLLEGVCSVADREACHRGTGGERRPVQRAFERGAGL